MRPRTLIITAALVAVCFFAGIHAPAPSTSEAGLLDRFPLFQKLRNQQCNDNRVYPRNEVVCPGGVCNPPVPTVFDPIDWIEPEPPVDIEIQTLRDDGEIARNKRELELQARRIATLEAQMRELQLSLQRTVGVVETIRRDVTIQGQSQRSGQLAFRLRLDRSGNVVSVEPR